MKRKIVNIINFIRGCEPRCPDRDLLQPIINQMSLAKQYKFPVTWLMQYDSFIDERFISIVREGLLFGHEIGIWFEVVQPLVEAAGLEWRGRWGGWDYHCNVGFSIGYAPEKRKLLADICMEKFLDVFGFYPNSVGSWFMDSVLLGHLSDKYNITASCNCKDQLGTDGYSLWGGYYNQAFYPSRQNGFMPAQYVENQIPVPVFRMLGSDPIYQYECGMELQWLSNDECWQDVVTLEPVYSETGANRKWVEWFFDVNFNYPSLTFGYVQMGQENSFGWKAMADGYKMQMEVLNQVMKKNIVQVETLGDTGRWFKKNYPVNMPSSIVALNDWKNEGKKSIWYNSRFFRVNFLFRNHHFHIRDIHLFNENYSERYLNQTCDTSNCFYDTLPILDGFCWSGKDLFAQMTLVKQDANGCYKPVDLDGLEVHENESSLEIILSDPKFSITCNQDCLLYSGTSQNTWGLQMIWSEMAETAIVSVEDKKIEFQYKKFDYELILQQGYLKQVASNQILLLQEQGALQLCFDENAHS